MDTRNEREMTALEILTAIIMLAGIVVCIGALVWRLALAITG